MEDGSTLSFYERYREAASHTDGMITFDRPATMRNLSQRGLMHNYDNYVEHRRKLIEAMRKAGASFDAIVKTLRSESQLLLTHQTTMRPLIQNSLEIPAEKRGIFAASLREEKTRYAQIGKALGVSDVRARQIAIRGKRDAEIPVWLDGLDKRLARAILLAGFKNVEAVKSALASGKPIPRIGESRMAIIRNWLSM